MNPPARDFSKGSVLPHTVAATLRRRAACAARGKSRSAYTTRVTFRPPPFPGSHARMISAHAGCPAMTPAESRSERQHVKSIVQSWRISAERLKLVSPFTQREFDSNLRAVPDRAAILLTGTDSTSPQHYSPTQGGCMSRAERLL